MTQATTRTPEPGALEPRRALETEAAACSHIGRRANNEDAVCVEPALGLYAVADGMGGYEGGEIASHLVVDTMSTFFRRNAEDEDLTWPIGLDPNATLEENMLRVAVQLADFEVRLRKQGKLEQMGSTVASLVLVGRRAVIAHVGDSRVYLLRGGVFRQLTRDHSLRAMLEDLEGGPLPDGRAEHLGHVITRAIGQTGNADPELSTGTVQAGDVFLLCSDGLSDPLPDEVLERHLARPPKQAASALVQAAYDAGGADNITALVVRVL